MEAHDAGDPHQGDAWLGAWRIRATRILMRRRKGVAQGFLLYPPDGFAGTINLGVIAAGRRDEFPHVWNIPDRSPMLFAVPLFGSGSPGPDRPASRSPGPDRADLLLESSAAGVLSGTLAFARATAIARIYVCPLLPPPHAASPAARDRNDDEARAPAESLLESALQALERGKRLRAGWAADWAPWIAARELGPRVRALAAAGRIELLATGACEPPSVAALDLPVAVRTAWRLHDRAPALPSDLPSPIRNLIISESERPGALSAAEAEEGRRGLPLRIAAGESQVIAHRSSAELGMQTLLPVDGAPPAIYFDRLMRQGLAWREGSEADRRVNGLAFCPLILSDVNSWRELRGFVIRWNKRHLSPVAIGATPADYFAAVEELEASGAVHL
ncbi:MAG: hypothetical protein V1774_01685 [Candidatus Eisenbacteria bacterium]